ncbi:MAG: hypothetical protein M3387_01910 [Actinomycetota bacterium]|nr:hypothetical protein [Actinomycetota bacterium]
MRIEEFAQLFGSFQRSAFRLETLTEYRVDDEQETFRLFLQGKPLPPHQPSEWVRLVQDAVAAGKTMERVHVVPSLLTPYLRFEIEWGYLHSVEAGERVYLLAADASDPVWDLATEDFWLFDDDVAVVMDYDDQGGFLRPLAVEDPDKVKEYCGVREQLLSVAVPLEQHLAGARTA